MEGEKRMGEGERKQDEERREEEEGRNGREYMTKFDLNNSLPAPRKNGSSQQWMYPHIHVRLGNPKYSS